MTNGELYTIKKNTYWKLFDNFEHKSVRIYIKKGQLFSISSKEKIEQLSVPICESFFNDSPEDKYFYVVQMPYWRYKRPVYAIRKDIFESIFEPYYKEIK